MWFKSDYWDWYTEKDKIYVVRTRVLGYHLEFRSDIWVFGYFNIRSKTCLDIFIYQIRFKYIYSAFNYSEYNWISKLCDDLVKKQEQTSFDLPDSRVFSSDLRDSLVFSLIWISVKVTNCHSLVVPCKFYVWKKEHESVSFVAPTPTSHIIILINILYISESSVFLTLIYGVYVQ